MICFFQGKFISVKLIHCLHWVFLTDTKCDFYVVQILLFLKSINLIDFASPIFMTDLIYAFLTEVMDFLSLSLKLWFFPLKEKKNFY